MKETTEKGFKYNGRSGQKIKIVLVLIHKHCGDKLLVKGIAVSAFISEWA